MEVLDETIRRHCLGCLVSEECSLQLFTVRCEPLKAIIQEDSISLCYLCKRLAQHAEQFIQNVQSNQILLANFSIDQSSLQAIQSQVIPSIILTQTSISTMEMSGTETEMVMDEVSYFIISSRDPQIKVELDLKEEGIAEGFYSDDDYQDPSVKEEDDFPLNTLLKQEIELDSVDLKTLKKTLKMKKVKKKDGRKKNRKKMFIDKHSDSINNIIIVRNKAKTNHFTTIQITEKHCLKEMEELAIDQTYIDSTYKCEDCVKGFILKESYDRHMEKHSIIRGKYWCTICKQRFESSYKLRCHRKIHIIRFKCNECELTRVSRRAMLEHYVSKHSAEGCEYKCEHCPKVFARHSTLTKHIDLRHSGRKSKVVCEICQKTYADNRSLLTHVLRKHRKEGDMDPFPKRYVCVECGASFHAPSLLRNHSVVHSERRDHYCVECDKSFKTSTILQRHLKTAAPHINYSELPLLCEHCDKRFAIKRDLERHINRVHLNVKPYSCDKCDKAYINDWSLREHIRYSHEGAKRPLQYPCSMCDKIFDRNSILKSHMRTHTGERPYQCSRCPAQFTQSSALGTHVKLIHLKLTRDGRPKPNSMNKPKVNFN